MIEIMLMRTEHLSPDCMCKYRLGADREKKILSMRCADDRKRSLGAGILLKKYLSSHGRKMEEVKTGSYGKPYVPGLHFSIAHSGDFAILAHSDMETGCDVQVMNGIREAVVKREYTPEEQQAVYRSNQPEKTFYEIWTAKEAYLKMKGTGIRSHLNRLDVSEKDRVIENGEEISVFLHHTWIENTVIAVCTPHCDDLTVRMITES